MRHFLIALLFLFSFSAVAAPPIEPETLLGPAPPYVPRKTDYSLEGGWLTAADDDLWGSALIGAHLGRCLFTESETCQQYIDGQFGIAAREGETQTHYWSSLRWQYVNLPDRYSTYWRVIGGATSIARLGSDRFWRPAIGGGVGVTTYLHDKVDLRVEVRGLVVDKAYLQAVVGVNIKVDRLLSVFAIKLKELGYGTIETAAEATGTAIQATGEGLGGVVEGVSKPFRTKKESEPAK